jgi:hypothetical protein
MGPRRLHVGFGNGAHDTTQVVWGEGGAAANAPGWLRDAAQLGWSYAAGAPVPENAAPPAQEGEAAGVDPPKGPGGFADELDGLLGALLAPSARADRVFAWMARGAVAVIQLCRRLLVTGLPDAETWAVLIRSALLFRVAGWLIAAFGVIGLARSAGDSGPDTVLDALDRFRATLGASADPPLNAAFDFLRQAVAAAWPVVADFADPLPGARSCSGSAASFPVPWIARRAGTGPVSSPVRGQNPQARGIKAKCNRLVQASKAFASGSPTQSHFSATTAPDFRRSISPCGRASASRTIAVGQARCVERFQSRRLDAYFDRLRPRGFAAQIGLNSKGSPSFGLAIGNRLHEGL